MQERRTDGAGREGPLERLRVLDIGTFIAAPWLGPALGEHTEEVLSSVLNLDRERIHALRRDGVV